MFIRIIPLLFFSYCILTSHEFSIDNGNPAGNYYRSQWAYFEESIVISVNYPSEINQVKIYYSGDIPTKDTLWIVGFPTSGNLWPTQYVWEYNSLIDPIIINYDGTPGWKIIDISNKNLRSEGLDKIVIQHKMKPQGPWFTYDNDGRKFNYNSWITDPFTPNSNFYNIIGTIFYYPPGDYMIRLEAELDYPIVDGKLLAPPPYFKNVTKEVGLTGRGMSSVIDWNNDFWDDIVNAGNFFENDRKGAFININDKLDIARGNSTWGDINNDGLKDIFIANSWENNKIYLNKGNNVFQDITQISTVVNNYPTMTPIWLDYNNDGFLDLFIANNRTTINGQEIYYPDQLWKNNGDLTFTNVRYESKINLGEPSQNYDCYGASANDYNNDNLIDIFVANYRLAPDNQYKNNGDGTFQDVAAQTGLQGVSTASPDYFGHGMGCQWGDFNNDGYIDLCVGNLAHTDSRGLFSNPSLIFKNSGPPNYTFEEVHKEMGLKFYEGNAGVMWLDLDLDGYLDLWHGLYDGGVNHLYLNQGPPDYFLKEITFLSGTVVNNPWTASYIDYDRDGDLDMLIYGELYRNDLQRKGNWLEIKLQGSPENNVNTDAYGSRIYAYAGNKLFMRQLSGSAAGSRCSQNSDIIHFGLGNANILDSLIIYYSNGNKKIITNLETNAFYFIPYNSSPQKISVATPALKYPTQYLSGINNQNINLQWYKSSGTLNYRCQISSDISFENIIINELVEGNNFFVNELENNKTYFWRVKAYSGNDSSNYSSIWQFTVGKETPGKIEILAPENNSNNVSVNIKVIWSSVNYICDFCDNNYYEIQVSEQNNFNQTIFHEFLRDTNIVLQNVLKASTKYFVRVRAINDTVNGDWSDVISFTTKDKPSVITLLSPPNGATDIDKKPKFEWQTLPDIDSYHLQTSEFIDFKEIFFEKDDIKTNSFKNLAISFQEGTTYYWRVRAKNEGGYGDWSEIWSFTVEGIKPQVDDTKSSLFDIKVMPNPSDNIFTIYFDSKIDITEPILVEIYSTKSQKVFSQYLEYEHNKIMNINTQEFPNGLYIIKVNTNFYTKFIKLVVIH